MTAEELDLLHRAVLRAGRDGADGGTPVVSLVVELEPARGPRPFSFPNTYQAVRGLTGFDRVMVYRYDADYNGEVVAEAKVGGLDSFVGLHYPASDIPAQARALYEKNWSG